MSVPQGLVETWRTRGATLRGDPVVYRRFVSESRDLKLGQLSPTFSSSTVEGVLVSGTVGGETAAVRFRFLTDRLPEAPPDKRSRILYQDHDFIILRYETDQTRTVYDLICKRA